MSLPDSVLADLLEGFPFVRVTVTGDCMRPALDHGDHVRLVSRERQPPRLGDVVLARHAEGLRLHRLVWGPPIALVGGWRTKADRAAVWDPRLRPDDVLATVVAVEGRSAPQRSATLALGSLARALWTRLRTGGWRDAGDAAGP